MIVMRFANESFYYNEGYEAAFVSNQPNACSYPPSAEGHGSVRSGSEDGKMAMLTPTTKRPMTKANCYFIRG